MSAYEPEIEEALKRHSLSSYAELDPTIFTERQKAHFGLNAYFLGQLDGKDPTPIADLSDYWTQDDGMTVPAGETLQVVTKGVVPNGRADFRMKLPDFDVDGQNFYFGFENGGRVGGAIACFVFKREGGADHLYVDSKSDFANIGPEVEVTDALPSDYGTTKNVYTVQVNRNVVEFRINGSLVAVSVNSADLAFGNIGYPPYAVIRGAPLSQPMFFVELQNTASDTEQNVPLRPFGTRFVPGHPVRPRTYRLRDDGADTLLTSGTYDTGTSYKSHPVPALGYDGKTLLFRADTDSVTDGLGVEVLTQEGNWRTYLTRTYSANTLESIVPTGEFPLMRLAYEPSADGASITDAEVSLE